MKYRVKITKLPQARTGYQVQGGLANDIATIGGGDFNSYNGKKQLQTRQSMGAVPRDEANLEAEGGETLVGDLDGSRFPSFFGIKGPRHSAGGVPMSLPDDTFIFSDTKTMKINDPKLLKMFGKSPKKGGYTPAELSKVYDVNKYRKILQDPESNKMEIKTAEMMIKNYVMKLGALAIAQESKKSFPQGIPIIAKPYMEANKITEEDLMPELAKQRKEEEAMQQQMMAQQQQVPQEGMPQEGMEQGPPPMQMPDGQLIAQPSMEQGIAEAEQMAPEQMQQGPMAKYGIVMGGFGMPLILENGGSSFYSRQNPMGNNSSKLNMFTGDDLYEAQDGIVIKPYEKANIPEGNVTPMGTNNQFSSKGVPLPEYLKSWESNIPGISKMSEGEAQKAMYEWSLKNNPDSISNMWGTHGLTAQGMKLKDQRALSIDGSGKFTAEQLKDPAFLAKLQASYVDKKFGIRQLDPNVPPPPKEKQCPCEDDNGAAIPGVFADRDDAGNCLPETCYEETQKCYCVDPETGQEVEVQLTNGECDCESQGLEQGSYQGQNQGGYGFPEWTTQDKLNLGTAMRTRTGIHYPTAMTYQTPEIELAKQEWLAGNQAIQGQAASNLHFLSNTAGPSTLKQAAAASLDGEASEKMVNNTAGVQAANVGTENQERTLNFQGRTASGQNRQNLMNMYVGDVNQTENNYAGELNAKDALKTQMANTGIKNAADLYNLQTEQYRIDPRTGMQIFKGGKKIKPDPNDVDDVTYVQNLQAAGLKDDQIELLLKDRLTKRLGGSTFQHGGLVYGNSTYPFYND
jgi:hypothetical protein